METALILALPELAGVVDRWRVPSVGNARLGLPPHVTVLFPWVPSEPAEPDLRRLRHAIRGFEPFSLTFREVATFPGCPGFVWLRPEPADLVLRLCLAVSAEFGEFSPYAGRHPDPVPHLTVAECSDPEATAARAAAIAGELPPLLADLGPIRIAGLDLAAQQEAGGAWRVGRIATLGASR
ncbi:MAG: 2'-5' RNA ligase family protein [Candidatus Dormibacteraceae bacterium]